MKLRGSVLINTLILFGIFLSLTVGLFEQFKSWQQRYRVILKVEKAQFETTYSRWRQQKEADKQTSENVSNNQGSSTSGAVESSSTTVEGAPFTEIQPPQTKSTETQSSKAEMLE